MRTFNLPQPTNLFYNQPDFSALASFLNPQPLSQQSLLGKRPNPSFDNLMFQDTIQKKLKTNYMLQSQPVLPPLANLLFQQNFEENQRIQDQLALLNLQRAIAMKNEQEPRFQENLILQSFPTEPIMPVFSKNIVKEEFIQEQDQDLATTHGSPSASLKNSPSVASSKGSAKKEAKKEIKKPVQIEHSSLIEVPALAELTETFPEWDLATIFQFLRSEKSIEVFEEERQKKLEKKKLRKPVQRKPKNKAAGKKSQ